MSGEIRLLLFAGALLTLIYFAHYIRKGRMQIDYACLLYTSTAIKQENPGVKIIVGGTHATVLSEQVLKECMAIDVVARQEYDFTLDEIMKNANDLSKVLGITYRAADGSIIHQPDRPWTEDLDELPMVSKVYEKFLNVNEMCIRDSIGII